MRAPSTRCIILSVGSITLVAIGIPKDADPFEWLGVEWECLLSYTLYTLSEMFEILIEQADGLLRKHNDEHHGGEGNYEG